MDRTLQSWRSPRAKLPGWEKGSLWLICPAAIEVKNESSRRSQIIRRPLPTNRLTFPLKRELNWESLIFQFVLLCYRLGIFSLKTIFLLNAADFVTLYSRPSAYVGKGGCCFYPGLATHGKNHPGDKTTTAPFAKNAHSVETFLLTFSRKVVFLAKNGEAKKVSSMYIWSV